MTLTKEEFSLYSRQIFVKELGVKAQETLQKTPIAVIGLGGLGSAVTLYLNSSGFGKILLFDFDEVDISNLARQVIHSASNLGDNKTLSAQKSLNFLNEKKDASKIRQNSILSFTEKLDKTQLEATLVSHKISIVVDCSDNFQTRAQLNEIAVHNKMALISGSCIGLQGQLTTYDFRFENLGPCYNCLFSDVLDESMPADTCASAGVISPLVGVIGSLQVLEAIKLANNLQSLQGKLILFNSLTMAFQETLIHKDKGCKICNIF